MKKSFLQANHFLFLCFICFFSKAYSQCTFGNYPPPYTVIGSYSQDFLLGTKHTLATSATLTGLGYQGNGTGAGIQMAIYTDVSGVVGTLVAFTNTSTVLSGNTVLNLATPTVIPAGDYWIMANYSASGNHVPKTTSSSNTVSYISLTFGTNPPTSASWITYPNQDFNYWAVITNTNVVTISGPNTLCAGNTLTLTASGAGTYTWDTGPTTATIALSPTVTTSYTVNANTGSCFSSAVTTIAVLAQPTLNVSGTATICNGSTATLSASGANTYTWNTAANTASISVSPTTATTYTVNGSSAAGCSNSATFSVAVNAQPTVNATSSSSLICTGQTVTLTATGANTYTWNPGGSGTVIAVMPTTTTSYVVTGSGLNGCTNTFTLTQPVSACTGIDKYTTSNSGPIVYPNPFKTKLILVSDNKGTVQIFNSLGALVYKTEIENEQTEIDLNNQPNGIYFIRVGPVTKKIIKE